MNDLDRTLDALDKKSQDLEDSINNDEQAIEKASMQIEEANKQIEEARDRQIIARDVRARIAEARDKVLEAKKAMAEISTISNVGDEEKTNDDTHTIVSETSYPDNTDTAEEVIEEDSNNNTQLVVYQEKEEKNNNSRKIVTTIGVIVLLGAIAAGCYALIKEARSGKVKDINNDDLNKSMSDTLLEDENTKIDANNIENNMTFDSNDTYEELTTEKFNALVDDVKASFESINLAVKAEDARKFAMVLNVDKLAQDNKELIYEIIGNQNPDEVFADADAVIDTIMTYNYEYYYNDDDAIIKAYEDGVAYKHDIDGFIKLSDFIFDKEQKEIVMEVESRISEINDSVRDNEQMNELVYKLLKDMIGATSKLSMLEDGVNYAVEWVYIELIRGMFGMDLDGNITLNATNADLVKYYVSYVEDDKSYYDNSSVNGSLRNVNTLLNDCKDKTLTKTN